MCSGACILWLKPVPKRFLHAVRLEPLWEKYDQRVCSKLDLFLCVTLAILACSTVHSLGSHAKLPTRECCTFRVPKGCTINTGNTFVRVPSDKLHYFPDITILRAAGLHLPLLEKQVQWDLGKKVGFSFLMLPRSSSQAGQMTCHSVTSPELVQLPTVATLLMARALRATLQRTTGSSSGMCVGMTVLNRKGQFMRKKRYCPATSMSEACL